MTVITLSFLAFISTLFVIRILRRHACKFGLVDAPGGRKKHEGAIPVVGGLGMFVAFAIAVLIQGQSLLPYHALLLGMLLLVAVGVLDDLHDLSARTRFVVQILVAVLMVSWGGVYLDNLGNLFGFGDIWLNAWAIPFTVFSVLGVINAFNMIDGIDGLAGGLALIALLFLAAIAILIGLNLEASLLLIMAGSVIGFLWFNLRTPWRSKAAVFMGDAGSMMLGFMLIWFAIDLSDKKTDAFYPIAAVWFLGVPIMDTVSTMLRRILKGQSPFVADREHLHHIFLRAGFSVSETVCIVLLVAVLFASIGLAGWYYQIPEYILCYAFLLLFIIHFTLMHHAWRFTKILKKMNRRRHLLKIMRRSRINQSREFIQTGHGANS